MGWIKSFVHFHGLDGPPDEARTDENSCPALLREARGQPGLRPATQPSLPEGDDRLATACSLRPHLAGIIGNGD